MWRLWRLWRRLCAVLVVLVTAEYVVLWAWFPGRIVDVIVAVGCWWYGCPPVRIGWQQ